MASRTQVVLVDDVDGTELHAGEGETVLFALDGVTYEIDLTGRNAERLRAAFAPYIRSGRRVGGRDRAGDRSRARVDKEQLQAARRWLQSHGHPVRERGRIKADLMALYLNSAGR